MAYTVFRSDLMHGTDSGVDLVSVRVYDASDEPIAVETGAIVELKEVFYDERKKNLDEFINDAGSICRGYILRSRNMFSVTKEGFVGGTAPAKGDAVGIGADGKINASGSGLGTTQAVEAAGRYTYYVIRIGNTEA